MKQRDKPGKRNTGRRQLRGADLSKVSKSSKQKVKEQKVKEPGVEPEIEEPNVKAYDALLTLLAPNDTKKKEHRKKASRVEKVQEENENGNELADDEEEDEDEGIQVEDDNEGDVTDPFETHYASPDPKVLEVDVNKVQFKRIKAGSRLGDRSTLEIPDTVEGPLMDPPSVKSINSLKLKYRLISPFTRENGDLTDLQKEFAGPLFAYQDMLFPGRTNRNGGRLQNAYTLHAINHIYKTRDRVLKNNAKGEVRDQGFTRPKVLVLLPTKHSCWKFVNKVVSISGLTQSENKKRFKEAFYHDVMPPSSKPEDFRDFFSGNTDDLFCLGMKFTRQALKLYTSFYSSDLIVASPLGLQRIVAKDFDFLSSIEVVIVDQADGIYMQNWDNVDSIFDNLNRTPKESHGCDFSRVREWYIHEKARLLRQTIVLTDYVTPEMNHLFTKCSNLGGKLRVKQATDGVLSRIGGQIRQTFTRLHPSSPLTDPDVRFKHFTAVVLPSLLRTNYAGTLVYVPNYNDFVRIRRYVEEEKIDCTCVSEYDEASHVSRARTYFAAQRVKILFISERFHNYRRYDLKGVNQVVMYGVPQNPRFYVEIMRFMVRTSIEQGMDLGMFRARIVYSKFDNIALQRIVGSERNGVLMQGTSDTYELK